MSQLTLELALREGLSNTSTGLRPDRRLLYEKQMRTSSRIFHPGAPRTKTYQGEWHYQSPFSCVPWSIMHSAKVISADYLHPAFLKFGEELFDFIGKDNKVEKLGMNFFEVVDIHRNHPQSGVRVLEDDAIGTTFDPPAAAGRRPYDNVHFLPIRQQNAHRIVGALDAGQSYAVSVDNYRLTGRPAGKGIYHAVCVGGYEIYDQGRMSVQLIDAGVGIYWTTLSHLSWSLRENETPLRIELASSPKLRRLPPRYY